MENTTKQGESTENGSEVNVNEVKAAKAKLLEAFNLHLRKASQTQANLARIARVSPQTLQQVVKGESSNRDAINIIKAYLPAFWHDHLM